MHITFFCWYFGDIFSRVFTFLEWDSNFICGDIFSCFCTILEQDSVQYHKVEFLLRVKSSV